MNTERITFSHLNEITARWSKKASLYLFLQKRNVGRVFSFQVFLPFRQKLEGFSATMKYTFAQDSEHTGYAYYACKALKDVFLVYGTDDHMVLSPSDTDRSKKRTLKKDSRWFVVQLFAKLIAFVPPVSFDGRQ